ncbi:hypothetical protein R2193_004128 [Cronobacter sakazakii]|nr:hypothetical protein [Cronobacter sakazakii]EJQ1504435.1 hypothetical protein [Cronobacter sakazakii]EJQ1513129.1 hypothetical protein [Cronobacter sakazakii]EJQ1523438.1 hypothetical protein [Cronobacter sakazakii]EJR1111900.1 hypothetical protein [Cronobacter sakazakii]
MTSKTSSNTKASKASPLTGLPPEVAQALRDRGDLAPAAIDALPAATDTDSALAKLNAMTAELEQQTGIKVSTAMNPSTAAATANALVATGLPAESTLARKAVRKQPIVMHRNPADSNPNMRYVTAPDAVDAYVSQQVQTQSCNTETAFTDAAGYYKAFSELNTALQSLPAFVPAPLGWTAEFTGKGEHVDPLSLLEQQPAERRAEMLHDLVRWACTVQRAQEHKDTRSALTELSRRAERADERLQQRHGQALLYKLNTLISLLQTKAFAGKPELLAELLLDDWKWLESGVAYKTPLAELSAYPALYDTGTMQPQCLVDSGSLSEFMQLHQRQLIDSYSCTTPLRDSDYDSISVGVLLKHTWVKAERIRAEADSPIMLQLGYQEQLPGGSRIDRDGINESWRDVIALTLVMEGDKLDIKPGNIPADSAVAKPVRDAVQALQLLNAAGK